MTSKELNQRLKNNMIDRLYLFYGKEDYIQETYIKKIKEMALTNDFTGLNYTQFDELPPKEVLVEAIEAAPIMSEKKVVFLNGLGISSPSLKKDVKTALMEILEDVPSYTVLIIKEKDEDAKKMSKPFLNLVRKYGAEVACDYLSGPDLLAFVNRQFAKQNKKIKKSDLEYFLSISDSSLHAIFNDVEKICMYLGERDTVDQETIDLLVKRSIEDRVFNLSDAIVNGKRAEAYQILHDLKLLKNQHPAGKIFSIVCDHFLNLYVVLNNQQARVPTETTLRVLELQGRQFLIKKYQNQGGKISLKKLEELISQLNLLDYQMKNGLVEPYFAIEKIIAGV